LTNGITLFKKKTIHLLLLRIVSYSVLHLRKIVRKDRRNCRDYCILMLQFYSSYRSHL